MGEKKMQNFLFLEERVELLVEVYQHVFNHRNPRLFKDFLVTGYKQTTLSSVSDQISEDVVYAKVCLGMIITLYDDLADNPNFYHPSLLRELYKLNIDECPSRPELGLKEESTYEIAIHLFEKLRGTLMRLPRYCEFEGVLAFDIRQVFLANQYAELMTSSPYIRNLSESRLFGPYNMGMVAAGMIDLMASPTFDKCELGEIREVLIQGQRIGRIGNLLATFKREEGEGDLTNEILLYPCGIGPAKDELLIELIEKLDRLKGAKNIGGIKISLYAEGLLEFYKLHRNLEGII